MEKGGEDRTETGPAAPPVPVAPASPPKHCLRMDYRLGSNAPLEQRIRAGEVVVARFHVYKSWGVGLAFARNRLFHGDVVINNPNHRGAAMHGDVVAVELLPRAAWERREGAGATGPASPFAGEADATTEAAAAVAVEEETRRGFLPDGRPIVRCTQREAAGAARHLQTAEVRLTYDLEAPVGEALWSREWKPVGRVIDVLFRELDAFQLCRLKESAVRPGESIRPGAFYMFRPFNPLLPYLTVPGSDLPAPYHDDLTSYLFLLRLEADASGALRNTRGDMIGARFHSVLGRSDSVVSNNWAIHSLYDIPQEHFSEEVEACVPPSFVIPDAEELARTGRRDLRREEFVCTIDPRTARDLDDALSIRRTPRGYHLGVHIADVSYFVPVGSALDEEAQRRSTSTYFVDKVIPMLPRTLSEHYCSLNPNEDKMAFSALFEMDHEGAVVSEWFGRSVIRSRCRLAYEEAQAMIDGATLEVPVGNADDDDDDDAALPARVHASVRLLFELAGKRRRTSLERGRLTMGNLRLAFAFDEADSRLAPRGFSVARQIQANWVVEEFMLLANARVAEKVVQFLPDEALLRRHGRPDGGKMRELSASLKAHGLPFCGSSAKALQQTLQDCQASPQCDAVCQMMKYALQRAEYMANGAVDTQSRAHFALGLPWYTHFTSPIRRYCDIIAHRQLLVALELEQLMTDAGVEPPRVPDPAVEARPGATAFQAASLVDPATLRTRDFFYPLSEIESITERANERHESARQASEKSNELFLCLFLEAVKGKAQVDPRLPAQLFTEVVVLKLSATSALLFSEEIASEVEVGWKDTRQEFTLVEAESEPETSAGNGPPAKREEPIIDVKNKAHRRQKGGKRDLPVPRGGREAGARAPAPTSVVLAWGTNPQTGTVEQEEVSLFSSLAVRLGVRRDRGRMMLDMVVLPPWKRGGAEGPLPRIPTALT